MEQTFSMPHVAARVFGVPLMIEPQKLEAILTFLGPRALGATEAAARIGGRSASEKMGMQVIDGVAILPISGTLVQRGAWLGQDNSGMTSYEGLQAQFHTAMADPAVEAILLDVDSGGGEVGGNFDFADSIFSARGVKPVWSIANDFAASAAYSLAASAEKLFVTRTASVGSIGVVMVHVDQSVRDEKNGVKYTSIYAGARKVDFSPHQPLSEEAFSTAQAMVDETYGIFVGNIARHRGMSEASVRATEAGIFTAREAVRLGLADSIATFGEVFSALRGRAASTHTLHPQPKETMTMTDTNTTATAAPAPQGVSEEETARQVAAATTAATERASAILASAGKLGIPQSVAEELIANAKLDKTQALQKLIDYRAEHADSNGITATAPVREATPDVSDPTLPIEERAKAEWDRDPKIRSEFRGSFSEYKAFRKAEEKGLVRIFGKHR